MFSINVTLVLQIVHFIIAYFILKKILLAPALAVIHQENNLKKELADKSSSIAQALTLLEQEKQLLWQDAYATFEGTIPHATSSYKKDMLPPLNIIHYTPQQQAAFEKSLTATIVRKAEDV